MDKSINKIIGNTTTTSMPRSDWNQTDENKADFILNKPSPVLLTHQELTDDQKTQARDNIDAASKEYVDEHDVLVFELTYDSATKKYIPVGVTFAELDAYASQNRMVSLCYTADDGDMKVYSFAYRNVSDTGRILYYTYSVANACYYLGFEDDAGASPYSSPTVLTSRTINGYALNKNITLTAEDVGAIENTVITNTISWDGDTTDREVVEFNAISHYKVSDIVLTDIGAFSGKVYRYYYSNGKTFNSDITPSDICYDINQGDALIVRGVIISGKAGSYNIPISTLQDGVQILPCTIPSDGTYMYTTSTLYYSAIDYSYIAPLDIQYIPSSIARASDVDAAISETRDYVDASIAGLVDTAPDALNTLNELASALGDDPNFATTVLEQVSNKVEKVEGKGLSTEDYSTADKTKVAGVEDGAKNTVILMASWTKDNVPMILTMSISGTTYPFENGTTWGDWVNSRFNTDGYYVATNGAVRTKNGYWVCNVNSEFMYQDDVIIKEHKYRIHYGGGGGEK